MKTIKLLEEITKIQERTIAAEKTVSNNILNRWHEQEQIITDWKYSYWKLERKFEKALEDIRFLNHYIEQKKIKKSFWASIIEILVTMSVGWNSYYWDPA